MGAAQAPELRAAYLLPFVEIRRSPPQRIRKNARDHGERV